MIEQLENLVRTGGLKAEAPDTNESAGLAHTVDVSKIQIRIFALCHERRNLAEYEGYLDVDEKLLEELLQATDVLLEKINQHT